MDKFRGKPNTPQPPLPPSSTKQGSQQQTREAIVRYNRQVRQYNEQVRSYKKTRRENAIHDTSLALSLIFRVIAIALALALIAQLWNIDFDLSDTMHTITSEAVPPIDFGKTIQNLNKWVAGLPAWLDWAGTGIRAVGMIAISTAYVTMFAVGMISVIFTGAGMPDGWETEQENS